MLIFLATLTKTIVSTVREDKARRAEILEGPRTVGTGAKRAEAGVTVFPAKQGEFSSPTCTYAWTQDGGWWLQRESRLGGQCVCGGLSQVCSQ